MNEDFPLHPSVSSSHGGERFELYWNHRTGYLRFLLGIARWWTDEWLINPIPDWPL